MPRFDHGWTSRISDGHRTVDLNRAPGPWLTNITYAGRRVLLPGIVALTKRPQFCMASGLSSWSSHPVIPRICSTTLKRAQRPNDVLYLFVQNAVANQSKVDSEKSNFHWP